MNAVFPVPVSRGWRRLLLAAAVAGFLLFFLPIPAGMPPLDFGLQLSEMYHALYFSFFVAVFLALAPLPPSRRKAAFLAFFTASLLAAAVEFLQPFFGRSCEFSDFVIGSTAAAAAAAVLGARLPLRRRFAAAALALPLLLFSPVAARYALLARPLRALFPTLYAPEKLCFFAPWDLHGVELFRDGTVVPTGEEAEYPGLFRLAARQDWSAFSALVLRVEWQGPEGTVGVVRVDPAGVRDPAYGERLQIEVPLARGENAIRLPLGAAPFNLERTGVWGFFLVSPGGFDYFRLVDAHLLPRSPSATDLP
jgi:VanZ family protein